MERMLLLMFVACMVISSPAAAGMFDDVLKGLAGSPRSGPDEGTTASGLKEALAIGTENAVKSVSAPDGYFGNTLIRILMPEKIQKVADVLKSIGFEKQVDAFVLSMNRAAERAAPKAAAIFGDAIREMSFEDARKILSGGDTAATEYFRGKTQDRIYGEFRPVIASSLGEVGATQAYKEMMGKYESVPFVSSQSLDLDHYVTNKAMDGLFVVVGQEEKKIRTDPAARATDLLKTVFGN